MAEVSGSAAAITFVTGNVVNAFRWTVSYVAEALDTTAFTDTERAFIPGITSWSGSYECWLDDTAVLVAPGAGVAQAIFQHSAGRTLTGTITVTNVEPSVARDGSARAWTCTFQGSGALAPA